MRQKRGTRNIPLIQQVLEASILNKCSHSSFWRGRQESTKHVSTPAWWQTKQLQTGMYYTCMYASSTQPKLSALLEHCLLSKLPLAPDLEGFNSKRCTEISTWQWSKSLFNFVKFQLFFTAEKLPPMWQSKVNMHKPSNVQCRYSSFSPSDTV